MSLSEFESALHKCDANKLVGMLVERLENLSKIKSYIDKIKIKAECSLIFDELLHKLSSASDSQLEELNKHLIETQTKATIFIQKALKNFYEITCNSLKEAAKKYAEIVLDERRQIIRENNLSNTLIRIDNQRDLSNFDTHRTYSPESMLNGLVDPIVHCLPDHKEIANLNNAKEAALVGFWQTLNFIKNQDNTAPVNTDSCWMQYRNRAINGVKELTKKESLVLFQESNPIEHFFKTLVNSICKSLGISPPFTQHKTQQYFKQAFEKVREQMGVEESTIADRESNAPKI